MPDARDLICELHRKDGGPPIGTLPAAWKRKLNDRWTIWVNGQPEALTADQHPTLGIGDVYVEYNGWPAGIWNLVTGDGVLASGSEVNYETFCRALREAIDA